MTAPDTIWELVRRGAETLPEPFSRKSLVDWVLRQRPDVEESSVGVHIQLATANASNTRNPFGHRGPLLDRVGHGQYRRHRPQCAAGPAFDRPTPPAPAPTCGSSVDIVLVGYSDSKAQTARPAGQLFTGTTFTKAREHAVRSGRPWYVLSAKFGLLAPDEVVAPYDVYLADRPTQYRSAWGAWVVAQLADRHDVRGSVVEVHAGQAYCEPLAGPLAEAGATLHQPLGGLRQGERLAWSGRVQPAAPEPPVPDVRALLDVANAMTPAEFLAVGRALSQPGLYSWWVDPAGAHDLSVGLGHHVPPGLLYAGRAGGIRAGGRASTNTLWGRVGEMHLGGNRAFSTFRLTLAACLSAAWGRVVMEAELGEWMLMRLRVAVLALAPGAVTAGETRLLALADPPLNLRDVPPTPVRRSLSRLCSALTSSA